MSSYIDSVDGTSHKAATSFSIHREERTPSESGSSHNSQYDAGNSSLNATHMPMTTSKLANQQYGAQGLESTFKKLNPPVTVDGNNISLLMRRKTQQNSFPANVNEPGPTFSMPPTARLSLVPANVSQPTHKQPISFNAGHETNRGQTINDKNVRMADLQKELEAAKKEIAGLNQQLSQHHVTQQTMDHVAATPAPVNIPLQEDPDVLLNRMKIHHRPTSPQTSDTNSGSHQQMRALDANDGPWANPTNVLFGRPPSGPPTWNYGPIAAWNAASAYGNVPNGPADMRNGFEHQRGGRADINASFSSGQHRGWRGSHPQTVPSSTTSFSPPLTPFDTIQGLNGWQPRPGALPFTPNVPDSSAPWNNFATPMTPVQQQQHQYMAPVEPMNYRRLLDRNVSCNWKYIVDKIICSNDQQASIFLQQKLKVSTAELKYELIEAIVAQGYPLMINRFGNFLIQRCLEHGTSDQVNAIANIIRGKTLELSMDAFGCHVVQKAFDVVPETYKASMVHELLRQIPQTVVHRYACHVWQKLFELRWSDSPPQIMKYVNEALYGMWHEVALGETGSLVVQNIFENCLDEDKRPCVTEVLANIDLIAHGQFGNWCIQHICEHGAPADKSCAIEHVLRHAVEYSTDQFASKVVEKCLKVAGTDFIDRYLGKVCEGRPDRPRMPLIDIAGDQYGNYLVQFVLLNADLGHREAVAQNIRKHMVSLRGSKFGSRVAMLCNNPAVATRPGPPPLGFTDRVYQQYNPTLGRNNLPGHCR